MNETSPSAPASSTPNPFDGPVRLDVPTDWNGRRTIHVAAGELDAMMTVAPDVQAELRAVAARQVERGGDVRITTDASGLHIVGVASGPLDPAQLLQVAYAADPVGLNRIAGMLGASSWEALCAGLQFAPEDTGGGCAMLVARTAHRVVVGLSDGDARLPVNAANFWVGVMPEVGEDDLYYAFVEGGRLTFQGGSWSA